MVLERADAACLPAIDAMRAACVAHMVAAGIEQWDDIYPTAEIFKRDCDQGNLLVMRADDDTIVGCAGLDERFSPEYGAIDWSINSDRIGAVHRLMILPKHQGRGYAKILMHEIEREARRRGYEVIRLDAFLKNPAALRLYAGLGYRQAGEVRFRKGSFACFEKRIA